MADRRRILGPLGPTRLPLFDYMIDSSVPKPERPRRSRKPDELRKIFVQTGLTPPASGSAYLELSPLSAPTLPTESQHVYQRLPTLKLSCAVHGPRPLPRSSPFSPHLQLSVHVKYTPYAARVRRGYIRDPAERDLSASLETALRGVVIGERYPKTGVDVCVTVLEAEEDTWGLGEGDSEGAGGPGIGGSWGTGSVLAGCISVAGAALMDAGIDCVDIVTGGTAAVVSKSAGSGQEIVLDPNPMEHSRIIASCVVGYLSTRDEMTLLWTRGSVSGHLNSKLVDAAVSSALGVRGVIESAVREGVVRKMKEIR